MPETSESVLPKLVGTLSDPTAVIEFSKTTFESRQADVVEVRFDAIPEADWPTVFLACDALETTGTSVISTLRLPEDGGKWTGSEAQRAPHFKEFLNHSSLVDIEVGSSIAKDVCAFAHGKGKRALVSFHDLVSTPSREVLEGHYATAIQYGADVVKFATMTDSPSQHAQIVGLVQAHAAEGKICAMGMGAHGLSLRIYLPAIGSILAYAYLDTPSAKGQLSCDRMLELLRLQIPRFNEKYLIRSGSLQAA